MAEISNLLVAVVSVAAVIAILLYATWLLTHRLRNGQPKRLAFGEWLRNVFEAIWGL